MRQFGRLAEDLTVEKCGSQEYQKVQKEIEDFDLNIYLCDSDFEQTFKKAIQVSDCIPIALFDFSSHCITYPSTFVLFVLSNRWR